jgi:hypothetical protein
MVRIVAFAVLAFLAVIARAESAPITKPCDSPEARQFDFWVGDWELSYVDEGKPAKSRNRITKILGGCALLEEFSGPPGTPLEGRSLSTFDRITHRWKQTWTDNTAAYLDFTGGFSEGRMVLSREAQRDGKRFLQRMVWQDIREDRLKWLWQRSDDGGRSWTTAWEIDYRRLR